MNFVFSSLCLSALVAKKIFLFCNENPIQQSYQKANFYENN